MKKNNKGFSEIVLILVIVALLGVVGFFVYRSSSSQDIVEKQMPLTKQADNVIVDSNPDGSFNTNSGFNPTQISALMRRARLSSVVAKGKFDKSFETKSYTTTNGKYQFEYPEHMSVFELPEEYDSTASYVMVTNNEQDSEYVNNLKKCIEEREPESQGICEISIGDYYIISMGNHIDGFFFKDSRPGYTPPEFGSIEIDSGQNASLTRNVVFLAETVLGNESQSSITLGVSHPPIYEYKLKLSGNTDLRFTSFAYPLTWPYRQTISTIVNSFRTQ